MTPRAALIGAGSAAGVLASRALDGFALLPGVHEPEAVRRAVLAPGWTVVGLLMCLLLGHLVSRLVRAAPWFAGVILVAGQLLVLGMPELLGRVGEAQPASGRAGEHWTSLASAVGLQVLLALLTVTTALLVVNLMATTASVSPCGSAAARLPTTPYSVVVKHRRCGGGGGRAPPGGCLHSPTHTLTQGARWTHAHSDGGWPSPLSSHC